MCIDYAFLCNKKSIDYMLINYKWPLEKLKLGSYSNSCSVPMLDCNDSVTWYSTQACSMLLHKWCFHTRIPRSRTDCDTQTVRYVGNPLHEDCNVAESEFGLCLIMNSLDLQSLVIWFTNVRTILYNQTLTTVFVPNLTVNFVLDSLEK
jgi:hypothetical protein